MNKIKKFKSLLYVEDEQSIREEMSEILEDFCEELHICSDGVEALSNFEKHNHQVIVTDIRMPNMDGIELSKRVKERDQNVHIVFTTAFSDRKYFLEAIELQLDGYILKPIKLDVLEEKLYKILASINFIIDSQVKNKILFQKSKLASMGEMLANISHQWKQPLSAITTSVTGMQIKKEHSQLDDNYMEECSKVVMEQANYLTSTINDFRNYLKPTDSDNPKCDVNNCLDKCLKLVEYTLSLENIKIIQNLDDEFECKGQSNQLIQAMLNILNNAKDALINNNVDEKLIFLSTKEIPEKEVIVVKIKDNAGGIKEEIIDRIFEPYFTDKSEDKGTGLGLYITYSIINEIMKGTIRVYNEIFEYKNKQYKGACFEIILPLYSFS